MTARPHPFRLVFGGLAEARFPAIRDAVGDAPALDHFLLAEAVVELLQELRPEEGIGEAMDDFVAFTHAAYSFWAAGEPTVEFDLPATRALCTSSEFPRAIAPERTAYIQISPRLVWGKLEPDAPHEPLDGWFALPDPAGLRVVACFGVHPERPGLSVVSLAGSVPASVVRADGTPRFAPTMEGGEVAGLFAVASPEELLLLAARADRIAGER